jgi:DNA ligase D-like protein (predicted 3'-phosphoesterase)
MLTTMPLEEYRRKRDFARTPEPRGAVRRKTSRKLFFCVQKHLASHLHYDFRLEWNGVLLSWAVPKGPSLNPADKRLAMQTEDHPYEYGMFEGVIPEGYGAGIVMLWDYGTWTPEVDDVDEALKKGDLKFRLDGYKLKGSWVLVRTGGRGPGGPPGRSWLLIKHRDQWAGAIDITTFAPYSVKTRGADLADILAADSPEIWRSGAPARGGNTGALFQKIIQKALSIREENARAQAAARGQAQAQEHTQAQPQADTQTPVQTPADRLKPGQADGRARAGAQARAGLVRHSEQAGTDAAPQRRSARPARPRARTRSGTGATPAGRGSSTRTGTRPKTKAR